jgi:peptidoglycan/xylan/chitin deacetylase (PgdA/CDA1 family)
MLLAVNYHYVSVEPRTGAAIFPVTTQDFGAQLDELGRTFEFVSRSDLLAAVGGGVSLPERACLITFDDGLRQQVELALPLLEERGIPAIFFVCGEPLDHPRVLFVHKVHQLRDCMTDAELREALADELAEEGIDPASISPELAAATYRYDTPEAAALKYLLNVVLGPSRPEPIDRMFSERFSEAELAEELYVSREHVVQLEAVDALGAHAYTHRPLAVLEPNAARDDLERGAGVLESITGRRPRAISYPYGVAAAVNATVAAAAGESGYAFGVTMERAFNTTLDQPLLLARLDANDAPGGRSPLFSVNGDGIVVRDGMTAGRSRYLEEVA